MGMKPSVSFSYQTRGVATILAYEEFGLMGYEMRIREDEEGYDVALAALGGNFDAVQKLLTEYVRGGKQ